MARSIRVRGVCWMVIALSIAAGTFALGGETAAEGENAAPPTGWTPEEMMKVKEVSHVRVSPDGRRVVFVVSEAVMTDERSEYLRHIYLADADGSNSRQLTFGEKSCTDAQWSPDGRWIAFRSERSGRGNLWLMRSDGGEARQLTDVKTAVSNFKWSPDGRAIAYISPDAPTPAEEKALKGKNDSKVAAEDFKRNRLWVVPTTPPSNGKPSEQSLTPGDFSVESGFDWSPGSEAIVFAHATTPRADDWATSDISVVHAASGKIEPIAQTKACEAFPFYSPDGRWIAYIVRDHTWRRTADVVVVASAGGAPRKLAETTDRQPQIVGWSADGQLIYFSETRGVVHRFSALPVGGGPPHDLDRGDAVIITPGDSANADFALNATRTVVGFVAQTSDRPPEAYLARLDRFAPVQVSRVNADLPSHPLGRTEVIHWKSSDGLEIEGLLTYPVGYVSGKRYPLLLVVHGGPASVFKQTFLAEPAPYPLAAFAARGYAVLRCNVRGSSGYGRAFRYANYKDWGGMDYQDLMTGVDYVIEKGVADPDRLGVMGWSYGGYMTSWVVTQTNRFKAASVGAGLPNLISFTGTTDIPGFLPDYFGGEYWESRELYLARSPLFHVQKVATPTLIQHGDADTRVPLSQSQEFYNALKRRGVPVTLVVYPRMGHRFQEPKEVFDLAQRNVEWFDRYLSP